jgi:Caspase domain
MLTQFQQGDRLLGSVEMLLSPAAALGDWKPTVAAALRLGLANGEALPVETATFVNIKNAFARWLQRAGSCPQNAAFLYFSGHGVWKSVPLLLPEDAQLPTATLPADNLIDIQQTETNLFNTPPSIQCFFVDACQEITPALLQNTDAIPGEALRRPVNAPAIPDRDAWLYIGSYTGAKAYGPDNDAPFFTQELLKCLERRGAGNSLGDGTWIVTTSSLRMALEAASGWRTEQEGKALRFSTIPGSSTFTATLCWIPGPPEVFVKIWCLPPETMAKAKLYVEAGGARRNRTAVLPGEWYTTVAQGGCQAGVEFDTAAALLNSVLTVQAYPPVQPIRLLVKPRPAGGGGS